MAIPVRLLLSRRKGFDLQQFSRNANGLPAAVVARPRRWGNPFRVGQPGDRGAATPAEAVSLFRIYLLTQLANNPDMLEPLRKKNLACWCALEIPCHADILLDYANR